MFSGFFTLVIMFNHSYADNPLSPSSPSLGSETEPESAEELEIVQVESLVDFEREIQPEVPSDFYKFNI